MFDCRVLTLALIMAANAAEVFVQTAPPCGAWISFGVITTSEDGQHGSKYGIDDDEAHRGRELN